MLSKVAAPICSSFTIRAGGCHFPCKKDLWREGKGVNEERKRKKKSKQKQTMQSVEERKAFALLWIKWIETKSVQKLKKKQYFRAEEGEGKCCFCHFSANHCIQGCSPCFPPRSVCSIPVFPSEDAACSAANFSLLIMTSFSELPSLDSLQVVCIFPGVLQSRGGNLQRSTKRGNGKKSLHGCELQSSASLNR